MFLPTLPFYQSESSHSAAASTCSPERDDVSKFATCLTLIAIYLQGAVFGKSFEDISEFIIQK